jgi:hypothetical protein
MSCISSTASPTLGGPPHCLSAADGMHGAYIIRCGFVIRCTSFYTEFYSTISNISQILFIEIRILARR